MREERLTLTQTFIAIIIAMSISYFAFKSAKIKTAGASEPVVVKIGAIGNENNEWDTILMNVSAYCPCEICCEGFASIPVSSGKRKTASGHTIRVGDKFIASPRTYSFGTEMIVPGYNNDRVVIVQDRGGAIKGNCLDLYFDTHQEAKIWGRKDVLVKVRRK